MGIVLSLKTIMVHKMDFFKRIIPFAFVYINCIYGAFIWRPHYYNYLKNKNEEPHGCDDFIHGCCEYYTDCSIREVNGQEHLHAKSNYIDWHVIVKEDPLGKNCPRLKKILVDHNYKTTRNMNQQKLFEKIANCVNLSNQVSCNNKTISTCCSITYTCDIRYYWDVIYYHRDPSDIIDYYQQMVRSNSNQIQMYSNIYYSYLNGNHGDKCPTIEHIQNSYEGDNIITPPFYYTEVFLIISTMFIIIYLFFLCKSKRKDDHQELKTEGDELVSESEP